MSGLAWACLVLLAGCGWSHRDGEMTGQVKFVTRHTPLLCPEYVSASVSLGVIRAGEGSVSTHDVDFLVLDPPLEKVLRQAAQSGSIVRLRYDERRVTVCVPERVVTDVVLLGKTP